ncbi:Nramp family divalent metal transporter [Pseudonocardia sp. HH130630-07]|uniref:Nramp family divalent metal transporter n=1 Tax=Pseudonocardia sp. HH130630-07 TaxID=1690815 RepID=UPI000814E3AC|nr:Nramp family divalent metal transporter [Pseudonocardia sp. HH130630-07]ANY08556.1 divalent metal cation transporter [Pseudonocardia sp. HH130630-07]
MTTVGTDGPDTVEQLRGRGWRGRLVVLGPAFVAAVAYVDPGNFATNFSAGAGYGYLLVWVIVVANLMAMLIQSLSAKLGLATGASLPELCREHLSRWGNRFMWAQAELVAVATDLAEVIGGAVALHLLFGIPLFTGGVITGVIAFALLGLQSRGHRPFERAIVFLLLIILVGLASTAFRAGVDPAGLAAGLVPQFAGLDSLVLATGILGATVMPHVIYLHSALTQRRLVARSAADTRFLLRTGRTDIALGMGVAGLVNLSMLVVAAALFAGSTVPGTDTLEGIFAGLGTELDAVAAYGFAIALLASGFASSGVGTYAGQVIMAGFLRRRIPLLLRRLLTLAPALVVLGFGVDPTEALVLSQVILSFGIPFALAPLVWLTARRSIMGELVNHRATTVAAVVVTAVVVALNGVLLWQTFTGS